MDFLKNLASRIPFINSGEGEYIENYFSITVLTSIITSSIWQAHNKKVEILGSGSANYQGQEDLIDKVGLSIDHAVGESPIEPKKVLFGVPASWSSDDNLKEDKLRILKKIVSEYDLEPLAFVTVAHAISHYLHAKEGILPTGILLGIGETLEITILKAGKILDTKEIKRSDHLFDDLEKTLASFESVEVLPAKIVFYPTKEGENLEKLKDELISFPWMNRLSFLHFPKIDFLTDEKLNEAVVFAGAFEIDPEVKLDKSFSGVVDISVPPVPAVVKEVETAVVGVPSQIENFAQSRIPLWALPYIQRLKDLRYKLPVGFSTSGKGWLIIPGVLFSLILAFLFLIKAEVTVYVDPKVIENRSEVTADPGVDSIDETRSVIPGKIVSTSVSLSDKAPATGQKEIGNSAKGAVVIYNLTSQPVSFSQGTQLTNGDKRFTLDTSVQIASQSSTVAADFTTVIKPGKSDPVGVTASLIGPDSNIPAGTELSIGSHNKSSVVAKVDTALSGGTSKTVQVVTSEDQKKLQAKVLSELKNSAVGAIQGKLTGDQKVIAEGLNVMDASYKFSKQPNDQASEFSLNANVTFQGTAYSDSDLKMMVSKLVSTTIPEGFELNLQGSETQADVSKVDKNGKITFTAKFIAKLLPKMDQDLLKSKVRGKFVPSAISSLKSTENVIDAAVVLTPAIPSNFGIMPLLNNNITITVAPK